MVTRKYYIGAFIIENHIDADGVVFSIMRRPTTAELFCLYHVWSDIRVPKEDDITITLHDLLD